MSTVDSRVATLLGQSVLGHLAFNGHDGRPRVSPVWFLYEGGDLLIGSPRNAYKNRCLSADPRASFVVVSTTQPYQHVTLIADAVVEGVSDHERNQFLARISRHYLGTEGSKRYLEGFGSRRQTDDGGRIRLHPTRVRFYTSRGQPAGS
jgi:PPOX class probable F420-dependent enzyme